MEKLKLRKVGYLIHNFMASRGRVGIYTQGYSFPIILCRENYDKPLILVNFILE